MTRLRTWKGLSILVAVAVVLILFAFPLTASAQNTWHVSKWTKYAGNPVLNPGSAGEWDDAYVHGPEVLYDSATYHMWYTGYDGTTDRIGYATSPDGITWTKYNDPTTTAAPYAESDPILNPGSAGEWDDAGVYRPDVLYDGTTYHMWYDGCDGATYRIGYATSPDGITWNKYAGNPVLNPGSAGEWDEVVVQSPSVLYDGTTYHMWYDGCDTTTCRIGYATSPDGITWTKYAGNPVLNLGSSGEWDDSFINRPDVLYDGTTYHMWYGGDDGSVTYSIGYATSTNGITWSKYDDPITTVAPYAESDPVLNPGSAGEWDDTCIYSPGTLYDGTTYHMWYTSVDGTNRRIGYATNSYIDADFLSIKNAIEYADPDDTILVHPGKYDEKLLINKSLTLQSTDGWQNTHIDPAMDSIIRIEGDVSVTVQGFEITAGSHGIYIGEIFSTVNILDCFIHDNALDGIHVASEGDVLNIERNIISQNGIPGGGCGIYMSQAWNTTNIRDNIIGAWWDGEDPGTIYTGNRNDGIDIDDVPVGTDVIIEGNHIVENGIMVSADHGINLDSVAGSVDIHDNVIGAWTYYYGGGVAVGFVGNKNHGIHVGPVSDTSIISIEGNAISENGEDGINFGTGVGPIFGEVTILRNLIGAWTCYSGDYGYSGSPQRYYGNGDRGIEINQMGDSGASGTVTIEGNKISENHTGEVDETGIYIGNIYGVVTIEGNDIGSWTDRYGASYLGNNGAGILIFNVFSGAELTIGPDNSIKQNIGDGIDIGWGESDSSIEIHHNVLDDNGPWVCGTGVKLGSGGVCGAMVNDNIITNNHKGVYLDSNSRQNTIQDNLIANNGHGVWIEGDDNQIIRNNILNNVEIKSGIHLTDTAEGNIIHCNNIEGNLLYGLYNGNPDEAVAATGNWWGCVQGPGAAGCDTVFGNVLYDPWLLDEFQYCEECGGTRRPPPGVPTVNSWGIVAMITLFAGLLVWTVRRRLSAS